MSKRSPHNKKIIQAGDRYYRLEVIEELPLRKPTDHRRFKMRCDCGKIVEGEFGRNSKSCGCLRSQTFKELNPKKRLAEGEANFNRLMNSYQQSAKARGLVFTLTKEEFRILTKSDCYYCGRPPETVGIFNPNSYGAYIYNGVDRVDNNHGYLLSNTVPCCWRCNDAKHTQPQEEFIGWIKKAFIHLSTKGLL